MQSFSPQALEAFLHAVPEALLVVDGEGSIRYLNEKASTLFGYSQDLLLGRPVEVLIPEEVAQRHVYHRQAYAGAPRARRMGERRTLQGRRQDGSRFPVEVSLSPLRMEGTLYVLSLVREARERLDWQRRLERHVRNAAEQAAEREQLARLFSQGLQTPVRQLRQYAELLADHHSGQLEGPGRECLEALHYTAWRTEQQLAALHRYLSLDEETVNPTTVSLAWVMEEVRRQLRFAIEDREATVQMVGELPEVRVDPELCLELFRQLLDNALTHSPDSPWIVVGGGIMEGQWAVVSVRDNGPGISPADPEALFEPLRGGDPGEGRLGMGLAMARRIARVHGGEVWWVDSASPGTEFRVRLPLAH